MHARSRRRRWHYCPLPPGLISRGPRKLEQASSSKPTSCLLPGNFPTTVNLLAMCSRGETQNTYWSASESVPALLGSTPSLRNQRVLPNLTCALLEFLAPRLEPNCLPPGPLFLDVTLLPRCQTILYSAFSSSRFSSRILHSSAHTSFFSSPYQLC